MPLMQEAIPKEDWEKLDRGQKLPKRKVVPRPEPEKPKIDNEIKFDDIIPDEFVELQSAKQKPIKNEEGMRFIGYEVSIILEVPVKRGPGRPAEGEKKQTETKILHGWMAEGEFLKLRRAFLKKINPQVINW